MTNQLTKAISSLIQTHPFYATLILYLEPIEDDTVGTAATDGKRLIYNEDWFNTLPLEQAKGVVAHKAMHCALQHPIRIGSRDIHLWNIACDYAINLILIKAGFKLPEGVLIDPQYEGMGAEEIYSRLRQQGQDIKVCPWGRVIPYAPTHETAKLGEATAEWNRRVRQAIATARAHGVGYLSGDLEQIAKEIKKPRIDPREQLRRFIDNRTRIDYSWVHPNKRMLGSGIILPGIKADGISKLGVVADVSGSVSLDLVSQFYSDIQAAMEEGAVQETIVVQCDAMIKNVKKYEAGDTIDFKTYGRGGTAFSPAIEWFNTNEPEIAALIYFTDLQCSDFGKEPEFPVLWYAYGLESTLKNYVSKVPFGEVVEVYL